MSQRTTSDGNDAAGRAVGRRRLASPLVLSVLIAVALYAALVWAGGLWNLLANTRVLDLLVRGGVVQLTDADAGFVAGVPTTELWVQSQDPVDWPLVALAGLLFVGLWSLRALQFHEFAGFTGITGRGGPHVRAYLYGVGVNLFVPFRLGNAAAAAALVGQGAPPASAAQVVALSELAVTFQIVVFGLLAFVLLGFTTGLAVMVWPAAILLVALWFTRSGRTPPRAAARVSWQRAVGSVRALATRPATLVKVALLALAAFALEDLAAYVITMAFSSEHVILHPDPKVLLAAVVAGYLARAVPFTPGGVGQFEWGFAAALYVGGMGIPEAVTIAILDNAIRYVAGTAMLGAVKLGYGVEAELDDAVLLATAEARAEAAA